jgi:tetratricopeptide (TPR) repeat protein
VSPALEALVLRTLAKDPRERPATADAMRVELLACAPDVAPALAAAQEAEAARLALPVVPIAAVVVLAIAGVAGWAVMGRRGAPPAAPAAVAAPAAAPVAVPVAAPAAVPAPAAATTPTATPARDPGRAKALFAQAEDRRKAMDTDAAVRLYLRAEEADPELHEVHKKLGQCYQLLGDIPRARERYRRYLASSPPDADRIRASLDMLR